MIQQHKHKIRQLAMQVLYLWDSQGLQDRALAHQAVEEASDDIPTREEAVKTALAAWEFHPSADEWLTRLAPQWPVGRQAAVDRAILRLAVWEMTHSDTPPKVVIDEAIELAKQFSTQNSPAFINGVLDAVLKEHSALTGQPRTES